jgi:hypothetical protein
MPPTFGGKSLVTSRWATGAGPVSATATAGAWVAPPAGAPAGATVGAGREG